MRRGYKWFAIGTAAVVALGIAAAVRFYALPLISIGTAYKAKILCSGVFVSKRDPQSILDTDLSADDLAVLRFADARVDHDSQEVTAHFLGSAERKAVFREGQGCALAHREAGKPAPRHARTPADPLRGQPPRVDELDADAGRPPDVDQARLRAVLEQAFAEPDPALPRRTRAVVVVHKGRLVAERYAQGYSKDTALIGWSMTKSVINALVGILVKEGKIGLGDRCRSQSGKAQPTPAATSPGSSSCA